MLYLAVRITEGENYKSMADHINHGLRVPGSSMIEPDIPVMADISLLALKEKVNDRINLNPAERWLILQGNTIAEKSSPPIRYRQW